MVTPRSSESCGSVRAWVESRASPRPVATLRKIFPDVSAFASCWVIPLPPPWVESCSAWLAEIGSETTILRSVPEPSLETAVCTVCWADSPEVTPPALEPLLQPASTIDAPTAAVAAAHHTRVAELVTLIYSTVPAAQFLLWSPPVESPGYGR